MIYQVRQGGSLVARSLFIVIGLSLGMYLGALVMINQIANSSVSSIRYSDVSSREDALVVSPRNSSYHIATVSQIQPAINDVQNTINGDQLQ